MPEWLIEHGIGEIRAALVHDGEILEARIELDDGSVRAGTVLGARLLTAGRNGANAVAVTAAGASYLLPRGAPGIAEGAPLTIEVTREAIPGAEPWKLPLARCTDKPFGQAAGVADLAGRVLTMPAAHDELGKVGWDDVLEQARSGLGSFPGGELRLSATPAMTLIDVDGYLDAGELALAGCRAAARAIRLLQITGSIGIDLPTVGSRKVRQEAAQVIDDLVPQPFERTSVNGFGFIQIVRPRNRPSLLELAADGALFEARALLRRVAFAGVGSKVLVAHPSVVRALERQPSWLERLGRQIGGACRLRADPSLPMSGGYAEKA